MEALPPGQPGVPVAGDGPGPPAPRSGRLTQLRRVGIVVIPALLALNMATYSDVVGVDVVPAVVRILLACVALFGVVGFGLTRVLLPDGLRRHEWLWVLPVGCVGVAFAMTPLGFLQVPFMANLALVWLGGLALSAWAVRRRGWPPLRPPEAEGAGVGLQSPRAYLWPAYLWTLLIAIALIPLFRSGFLTVIGQGSDAHMAAGTAEFLRHNPPGGVDPALPVDQMWLTWRSKQAIYYAFGGVATFAGLETWEVLSTLGAFLIALATVGMYLVAREILGAGIGAAAIAMALAGLDRMVLHTGIHPYFNQTWGYLTTPFSLVLCWWVVKHPSKGAFALLALFLAVGAFAYPLAVPIPLLFLFVMWWLDRRERRRRGEKLVGWRDLWARLRAAPRRYRWPSYALLVILIVPLWGAYEKIEGASQLIVNPAYSLELWGGDLEDWFPEQQFFGIGQLESGWWAAMAVIVAFALAELRRLPRNVAAGLFAILAISAVIALQMRFRDYGWYFHFKMLAFVGPLVVLLAAVSIARLRSHPSRWARWGALAMLVVWTSWAAADSRAEVADTFDELPQTVLELRDWSDRLPAGSSIRLDMQPGAQLWAAYMLADHPVCSQRPLSDTAYPHPQLSRAADYVLVRLLAKPFDAVGAPLFQNKEFALYRLRSGLPGGDRCSQRFIQTVNRIQRG